VTVPRTAVNGLESCYTVSHQGDSPGAAPDWGGAKSDVYNCRCVGAGVRRAELRGVETVPRTAGAWT